MEKRLVKCISWNVNGMNAVMKNGFPQTVDALDADIVALQETKLQESKLTDEMRHIAGYESFWSFSTRKKGYSGVAVYSRTAPQEVRYGIGIPEFDEEGRILELDYGDFVFFNVYFPNGQMGDDRLKFKLDFYERFFEYAGRYRDAGRSLVIAGDYNTAHNEIDLKNDKANRNTSGFLRIERDWLDRIVSWDYVDTFRHFHPQTVQYSWWTYRYRARERNAGWRIDYFFVTREMIEKGQVRSAFIADDIYGSDHCPVGLVLEI